MRHELGAVREGEEIVGDGREERLARQKGARQAVHGERLLRHVALRIEIMVQRLAGRNAVQQFDAADLDHAVAGTRIEARRFRIEDDLTHVRRLPRERR